MIELDEDNPEILRENLFRYLYTQLEQINTISSFLVTISHNISNAKLDDKNITSIFELFEKIFADAMKDLQKLHNI